MLKFAETQITFEEVPTEITLCINISNCPIRCTNCHSKHLWENIGDVLDERALDVLITSNFGISCVALMGGDCDVDSIVRLGTYIKQQHPKLKVAWYSGRDPKYMDFIRENYGFNWVDYIKLGPYKEEFGGLSSPTTNQKFYAISRNGMLVDCTKNFQKN